jgi:hypothetical protein
VEDAIEDGDIPLLPGGDCLEFQLAFSSLLLTDMFTAGADEAQQRELEEGLRDLRNLVPGEIEADFEVVADAFGEAMALTFGAGPSGPGPEAEAQAAAVLESPEVQQAQASINAWIEANCT